MSKLEDALEEAKGDNIAESAYDKAKEVGTKKAKQEGMKAAKKGGKKALGGAKSAVKSVSQKGLGGAIKGGAKSFVGGAKTAVKGAAAFVKSGPIGWGAGAMAIILAGAIASSSGDGDVADIGVDDSLIPEEEAAMLISEEECPPADYSDSSADSGNYSGGLDDPTSTYYQNAKRVFEQWVGAGLTGEAAAGIIGWTSSEGDFHMLGRAEGYYASNDPKKASVAYGNEPIPSLSSYSVGGGGIYQFTPYTKYAPLGSPDWEDFDKMHAYLFNQITNKGDWIPGPNDYSGKKHSFEEFARSTIIEDTTLAWNSYERMNRGTWERNLPGIKDKKIKEAKKAYEVFGGANYQFNEQAFNSHFGGSGDYTQDTDTGYIDKCVGESIGGSPWGGEGGQPSITSGVFKYNMVPDELKQYALDLESLPLKYGVASDWNYNTSLDHMQCVDLTSNLIKLIWEKGGKPIGDTKRMGNGGAVVGNYVGRFGGTSSTEPTAGAVFSTQTGVTMCGGSLCGHTGVVSHVFDNGDFLVIEQNWGKYSGRGAGKNTYNYRYVQQGAISRDRFTFYDPSTSGHVLAEGLKSL